ncbi:MULTISPECIES: hypothetical protein [Pseudoxanthomonas]|jgi:hypothetical protein|uniref:Uncharacterized protein n=1 Tax=Pseudoxanthomonas winnipegensis TaxID=2480810 RepID=A0A4V2HFC4_9GAMM|nr:MULTISPECIES: hypothetical protein [Pseudoxanthomonas]MDQ1118117.1 hypothetical protein [Pseudoxanthomonas winnipegensis]MDQ1135087.1 hypothetical protein [Pseudoxanthomonas winnipegensis]MDR6138682.1 hypothetical protein [Pseudoxanthomonas sp. SORGH_AS_0997]RZZ86122.1 hypothetical protein EA662_09390 [Pseudoxanthomonas winnipegensis]TAA12143.1 hypothetical protein EA659_02035 [Pseudoxanthomonas winnipegensis]
MPSPESNQAAHVAFTATVASALARSVRDTPLRPRQDAPAPEALPAAEVTDVPADFALGGSEEAA